MDQLSTEIDSIEMDLRDQRQFLNKTTATDIIDLQVGATPVTVGRTLLTQIKGSKMAQTFSGDHSLKLMDNKRLFIDRNPQIFEYCLQYLRSGR